MNRRDRLIAVGCFLTLPVLAFWLAPEPPATSRTGAVVETSWTLPSLPSTEAVQTAYEQLRARRAAAIAERGGSGNSESSNPPLVEADWRLRGVVQANGVRYAVIETVDGKTQRFREGEWLPKGEKLLTVRRDSIEIRDRDAMEIRVLYRAKAEPPVEQNQR